MMNPFTTLPRLLSVYIGIRGFLKNIPEIERLRSEGKTKEEQECVRLGQKQFVERTAPKIGINFEVKGEENIPDKGPFMVYSNHQSYADILAMIWIFRNHCQMGYVAKDEWRKFKPVAEAISYSHSVFLMRDNPREAVKAVKEVADLLAQGFNFVIFPEGTRSQCHEMGEFKPGAFKFAEKGKVPILPVTLDGGYHLLEEKGTYQPTTMKITIHPLVHIEEMDKQAQKQAAEDIEATIRSAL